MTNEPTDLPEVDLSEQSSAVSVDDVTEALKDVVDPELGINVVDLGLVYGVHVDDDNVATLDMTLTSAACPLTDVIEDQTRQALTTGPGGGLVDDFRITHSDGVTNVRNAPSPAATSSFAIAEYVVDEVDRAG